MLYEQSFIQVYWSDIGGTTNGEYNIRFQCIEGCEADSDDEDAVEAVIEDIGSYTYSEFDADDNEIFYQYLVLALPEELVAHDDDVVEAAAQNPELYPPNTFTLAVQVNTEEDNLFDLDDEDLYFTIRYTLESDRTVVYYNEDCDRTIVEDDGDERTFESFARMTNIQRNIYNLINNFIAGPIRQGCNWDRVFNHYME